MDNSLRPVDQIRQLVEQRRNLSDEAILNELTQLPVLPDEDDPLWNDRATWEKHAYVYLALADIAAERRLRVAVSLLLERACYGDPGEIMRGLRHDLEHIVNPEWSALADICTENMKSPNRGARLWSVDELGVIRDPRSLPMLISMLDDLDNGVRARACRSLALLCQANEPCREPAREALVNYLEKYRDVSDQKAGKNALKRIGDQ